MFTKVKRQINRTSRVRRIRAKVMGTPVRPRLAVYRSLQHVSAQLIDDTTGTTIAGLTDKGMTGTRIEKAKQVGQKIAELAKANKINAVVFDRAGFKYHGRIAAIAEGARANGLEF